MRLNMRKRPLRTQAGRGMTQGTRISAVAVLVVTLGACSSFKFSDVAVRQPSLRLADTAMDTGFPDLALRVAELTIAREPRNVRAHIARGDALYAMGQRDMAQSAYRTAIAIDSGAAGAQLGLGRTLARSDPPAAEAAFLAALRSEPNNIAALNDLGVMRGMQGRNAEARDTFRKALLVAPESVDIRINLGMSLALTGNAGEAVPLLREVAVDSNVAHTRGRELMAALTIAGDASWARQALNDTVQNSAAPPIELAANLPAVVSLPSDLAANRTDMREMMLATRGIGGQRPSGLNVSEPPAVIALANMKAVAPVRPNIAVPPIDATAGEPTPRQLAKVRSFDSWLLACAPNVAPSTLDAIIRTESGGNPLALHVNGAGEQPPPARDATAAAGIAASYVEGGYSVDVGLMQVNTRNLTATRNTLEQALDPCTNIVLGSTILSSFYAAATRARTNEPDALLAALSAYNTGDFRRGFTNGYVARVLSRGTTASPRPPRAPVAGDQGVTVRPPAQAHDPDTEMALVTLAIDLIEHRLIATRPHDADLSKGKVAMR